MTIGVPAPPIKPQAQSVSLMTSARPLPAKDEDGNRLEWERGVSFRQASTPLGHRWGWCSDATKVEPTAPGVVTFLPFWMYVPSACDEVLPVREPEHVAEAVAQMEAVTSWNLARELWTGENNSAQNLNPSLQTAAGIAGHAIAGPLDPVVAMGELLSKYVECSQAGGATYHVPSVLEPYLFAEKVVSQAGNVLYGPGGTVVISDYGYPTIAGNWGPRVDPAAGTAAAAHQAWLYISGPVEFAVGDIRPLPEKSDARYWNHRTNTWEVWAERMGIVRFDTTCVYAALVTVPQTAP